MGNPITTERAGRYRFADVVLTSSRALPDLPRAAVADRAVEIEIRWCEAGASVPDPIDWFHHWRDGAATWARFGRVGPGWLIEFPALARFLISADASHVEVAVTAGVPDITVSHLLLNQVLPLVLSRRGRLVLHAGAVSCGGPVTAFVGPTGSGKSTLVAACAAAGADVVCDDSLVVDRRDSVWLGVPSYPALRLWESALARMGWTVSDPAAHYTDKRRVGPEHGGWRFAAGAAPLQRLVLLPGDDPPRPVAVELFAQVFRLDVRDQREAVRLFHTVADLCADVEIVRLGRREMRDPMSTARRFL